MKLKVVVVDLELSASFKKWCLRLGIPLVLLLGAGTVAWAAGLHTWTSGDTLTAADLNGNFNALDTRITALEGQIHTPSAFRAELTNTTNIPNGAITKVVFNSVKYDLNNEYNPTNGNFTAKQAGTYLVECGMGYLATNSGGVATALVENGSTEVAAMDSANSTSNVVNPLASGVMALAAGDVVACNTYQSFGATHAVDTGHPARDYFAITRLY